MGTVSEPRQPLTEAEYRAALPGLMAKAADQVTDALPQEMRDAGMRFEWLPDAVKAFIETETGANLRYSPLRPDRFRREPLTECVRSEYGFMVHVKDACRCPGRGR